MRYRIVIPSHKRSDIIKQSIVCQLPPVPQCEIIVVVREGQEGDYRKVLPPHIKIHTVDFAGLAKTRNYILKELFTEDPQNLDFIMMLDDDVKNLKFTLSKIVKKVEPIQIYEVIEDTYKMCLAIGAKYFGFSDAVGSAMALTGPRYKPISFDARVSATLSGYIQKGRFFDPNIDIFEDMDYTLQSLFSDGVLVKNNMYFCEQIGGKMGITHGGLSDYRTGSKINDSKEYLLKKYGMFSQRWIVKHKGSVYGKSYEV